ncbi:MAG TPA: peptidylprolyl isomerase [Drouetiella sp.]
MKLRLMRSGASSQIALAMTLSMVLLSSCTNNSNKTDTTTQTSTTTTTTTNTSATDTKTDDKSGKKEQVADDVLPQIEAARKKIKLGKMPDSDVICTVGGTPITIGEYRRLLKSQEEQIQTALTADPAAQQTLVDQAKAEGISLTDDEKKRILETATRAEKAGDGAIKKHLDSIHETTQHFNDYVLRLGLAFKVATVHIEEHLLHSLVDREIICGAARTKGYGPAAMNVYLEAKKNPAFAKMVKDGYTADQLRDDIQKGELVRKMVEAIEKTATVSDADIQKFYDDHKDSFKHGEMVRLSQIVVAAPQKDSPEQPSMRTQIKQQSPAMSEADLNKKVLVVEQQQKQKAQDILARALKGEDFAKLADETSDDITARAAKTGGDMGFQDKTHLIKAFATKVDSIKVGKVYPELVNSEFGYHIIKLTDKKSGGVQPLAELKDQIKQLLTQNAQQKALKDWLADKRKSTEIVLSPEFQGLVSADTGKPKAQ